MKLLSIDPGLCLGYAVFQNGTLEDCGLVRGDTWEEVLPNLPDVSPDQVVCEDQFHVRKSRIKVGSILMLARITGGAYMNYHPAKFKLVKPAQWKGAVPKEVTTRRIMRRLDFEETETLDLNLRQYPKSLRHNAMDAIGIGLYWLQRSVPE